MAIQKDRLETIRIPIITFERQEKIIEEIEDLLHVQESLRKKLMKQLSKLKKYLKIIFKDLFIKLHQVNIKSN